MNDRDSMAETLDALDVPLLDARFANRVGSLARAELRAPSRGARSTRPPLSTLRGALVPALLTLAAIGHAATTAGTVAAIYGKEPITSSQ